MQIAPRIHRVGPDSIVNAYLVEDSGEVTIVDAGAPGLWRLLPAELAAMGRSLEDVRAIVLTHGHTDHVGFAELARRERGWPVLVHGADEALAKHEVPNPAKQGRMRLAPFAGFLWWSLRHGLLRVPAMTEVVTFGDGAMLDVPGARESSSFPGTRLARRHSTCRPTARCSWATHWPRTRSPPGSAVRGSLRSPPIPTWRWRRSRAWSRSTPGSSCRVTARPSPAAPPKPSVWRGRRGERWLSGRRRAAGVPPSVGRARAVRGAACGPDSARVASDSGALAPSRISAGSCHSGGRAAHEPPAPRV